MFKQSLTAKRIFLNACLPAAVVLFGAAAFAQPQAPNDRQRALELYDANNLVAALPLLEKVAAANPNDAMILSRLGFALYANSFTEKDPALRKKLRDRARTTLQRSKSLGDDSNLTRGTLDALSSGDPTDVPFSDVKAAEAAIREGEEAFVHGDLDKALAKYKRALELDPRLYAAALYAGDMEFKKGHNSTDPQFRSDAFDRAGVWFAKAIAIDANRETAYRYWGDALDAQGKTVEARDKFIDAIVAEPYGRQSYVGLTQWADRHNVSLGHPRIDIPSSVSSREKGQVDVTLDPKMLDNKDDGSSAWTLYGVKRALWMTKTFTERFPNEKEYRHTLAEEADALKVVAEETNWLVNNQKVKQLDPSLANLVKLNGAGLLEAFILFAKPDKGIVQDYASYRITNRDKLKRYWLEVVIGSPS